MNFLGTMTVETHEDQRGPLKAFGNLKIIQSSIVEWISPMVLEPINDGGMTEVEDGGRWV